MVSAMAWLTIPALIGPITGPPLGGFLTTYLSWHWIFWINVPIGVLGVLLVTRFLPEVGGRTERPIDLGGLALTGLTFAGILFGLSVLSMPVLPPVTGYASVVLGGVAGLLYLFWPAPRTEHPILDPRLFRLPLFRTAILGASLFRIGMGAFPFLMPLMLQLTFGLTPFESGMTTFVAAIGAIVSKLGTERIYAAFGFPRTLMVMSLVGCAFLAINALFTPEVPHWLLMGSLLMGGLTRSIFFTGVNALVFADIDEEKASQATSINAVAQQLSIASGVAVGGGALEIFSSLHGGELTLTDFHVSWIVVAAVSLSSVLFFVRMPPDAGSDMSGHTRRSRVTKPAEVVV
jgi:MFS family permease